MAPRGRPPKADLAKREEIRREYNQRKAARDWADALMRNAKVRKRRKFLEEVAETLARHTPEMTEADAMAVSLEEIERRWAKEIERRQAEERGGGPRRAALLSRRHAAFEKETKAKLKVSVRYRRAKGYREDIIEELAKEYGLSANLVRHIIDGE
jgi:hypothetical protein